MTTPLHSDPRTDPLLSGVPEREGFKVLDGRYVIFEVLGHGGMGVVYRGKHLGLGLEVAIKCLDPALARRDPSFVLRFEKEAQAAAMVDDPNVVRVHDVASVSGIHYMSMQFVQGENARERVQRKGQLSIDEALTIGVGATRGMAAAHAAGLIHRDIKPDNILISTKGEVKLADLGLAKVEGDSGMTYSGASMGTPKYMPPEQYDDAKRVGRSADVYGMGATLYFLLVGEDGITGRSLPEVLKQVGSLPFPRVRDKCPEVDPALDELIARCVEKDPELRPQSGAELLLALAPFAEVVNADLTDREASPTLAGVSLVSPPPEQTLLRIQMSLAEERTSGPKPQPPPGESAATEASDPDAQTLVSNQGAVAGGTGRGTAEDLTVAWDSGAQSGASEPPTSGGRGRALIILAVVALLAVALIWMALGDEGDEAVEPNGPESAEASPAVVPEPEPEAPEVALQTADDGRLYFAEELITLEGLVREPRGRGIVISGSGINLTTTLDGHDRFSVGLRLPANQSLVLELVADGYPTPAIMRLVQDSLDPVVSPAESLVLDVSSETLEVLVQVREANLARVTLAGEELRPQGGELWSLAAVPLALGANELVVIAEDLAGRRGEGALSITRRVPPGVEQPAPVVEVAIVLDTPLLVEGRLVTNEPFVRFSGQVRGFTGQTVTIQVDGQGTENQLLDATGHFAFDRGLILGVSQQVRLGTEGLAVPYQFEVIQDGIDPQIVFRSPLPNGQAVAAESFTLEVMVEDREVAAVRANGQGLSPQAVAGLPGLWAAHALPLPEEGPNKIIIKAEDTAGNTSQATLVVVRNTQPPAPLPWLYQAGDEAPALDEEGFTHLGPNSQGYHEYELALPNGASMVFVLLPGGSFAMGSDPGQKHSLPAEAPRHQVSLEAFLMAKTECTQEQYLAVTGQNHSKFVGAGTSAPVDSVSWSEAADFCAGLGLSLPSEAQWEYAARSGSTTALFSGNLTLISPNNSPSLGPIAWYAGNSVADYDGYRFPTKRWSDKPDHPFAGTQPVAEKNANGFGLHDTLGNVWEWCADGWFEDHGGAPEDGRSRSDAFGDTRVRRGGSFSSMAADCRSASRKSSPSNGSHPSTGFRPAKRLR